MKEINLTYIVPKSECSLLCLIWDFPGGSVVKNLSANAEGTGDTGLIPGSGKSPGEGNGNSLQYSCLGNPMDREAWWAIPSLGSQKNWTQLSNQTTINHCLLQEHKCT